MLDQTNIANSSNNQNRYNSAPSSLPISQRNYAVGTPDPMDAPTHASLAPNAINSSISQTGKATNSVQRSNHLPLLNPILLTALLPLAIATAAGYTLFQSNSQEQSNQQLTQQALLASQKATNILDNAARTTAAIASNPLVIDAARSSNEQASKEGLDQLPIDQIEQRLQNSKLSQPNPKLNAYLKEAGANISALEVLLTDRYGFNVGYTKAPAEVVQRNQLWWKQAKSQKQRVVEPALDAGTKALSVGISQGILDADSNQAVGVVRAVLPGSELTQIADALKQAGMGDSQQVQLFSTDTGRAIPMMPAGSNHAFKEVADQAVKNVAIALVKAQQAPLSKTQITSLETQNSLQNLIVTPINQDGGERAVSFIHQGTQYAIATIPQTQWVAIASMQAGVTGSNHPFLLVLGLTLLSLAAAATAATMYFNRRVSTPLRYLASAAEQISLGQLDEIAPLPSTPETQALVQALNHLVEKVKGFSQEQAIIAAQSRLLIDITSTRTLNDQDVEQVFNQALDDARNILQVERMVIYRFQLDGSGYISHESVASDWPRALNNSIEDACIPKALLDGYLSDRVVPTNDVFNAGFHPDHLKLMHRLKIKANLVVPILHAGRLFGLLIAHHCATSHAWQETEISFMRQLAAQLGVTLDRVTFVQSREAQAERSQFLRDITLQLTQADSSEGVLAQLPLLQIRQMLKADRVLLYRFDQTWKGTITAESVGDGWPRALGAQIHDPCFEKNYVEKYKRGRVQATSNIYAAGLTTCHLNQLEPFAVKANLVAPIMQGEQLLGLLIAHQCSAPRTWEQIEIDSFAQIANQIALALDRSRLLEQREAATKEALFLATEQRQQKETLNRQLTKLLGQVEEAAMGNLTVRAEVTTGEIGTVADFFNSIVENLGQIVTTVKESATRVSSAIGEDEVAILQLASVALKQAEETTRTLHSMEEMTLSIQAVADNARQAATVASHASTTAAAGGTAMDLTVQNILSLREMLGDTAKKMKRLGESSQQISKVVGMIEKIALQTNLLSINAGIEAARAGQDGQGFSVVAEEIGELAAKSGLATGEIEMIVNSIQMETAQVIEAMEQSTAKVVEGTRLVGDAKQSLNQMLQVSQQIDQLVNSISEATVSQTQTSQTVTSLIKQVVQVSRQTSDSSSKVSKSLQRTVEVAQELQASVGTFIVEPETQANALVIPE